jgi:hypothetical protein
MAKEATSAAMNSATEIIKRELFSFLATMAAG